MHYNMDCSKTLQKMSEEPEKQKKSQIEEGYKSVAFSLVFRSPERSLEAAEINKIVDKILKELEKMGVELRA